MFAPLATRYGVAEMTVIIIITTATTTTDSNKAAITTTARSTSTTTATATVTSEEEEGRGEEHQYHPPQRQERDYTLTVGPPVQKAVGAELLELQTQEDVEQVSGDGREHLNVGDSEDRQDTL